MKWQKSSFASEMAKKIQSMNCLLHACGVCIPMGNLGIPTCDSWSWLIAPAELTVVRSDQTLVKIRDAGKISFWALKSTN